MLKRILLAVAVVGFCSTSAFAQDEQVFVTFGQGADVGMTTATFDLDAGETTGSAFIFSAADFDFNAFDIDFVASDPSVISFTGAEVFNPINGIGAARFDGDETTVRATTTADSGRLIGVAVQASGVNPALGAAGLDPEFDVDANAFRVARIDFDVIGSGTTEINLLLGENEFFSDLTPDELIQPTFGDGTVNVDGDGGVAVPEPSTMGILAFGLVGFVARRRRS